MRSGKFETRSLLIIGVVGVNISLLDATTRTKRTTNDKHKRTLLNLFEPAANQQQRRESDERIVFTNPSEKYYARHRTIKKLKAMPDVEEIVELPDDKVVFTPANDYDYNDDEKVDEAELFDNMANDEDDDESTTEEINNDDVALATTTIPPMTAQSVDDDKDDEYNDEDEDRDSDDQNDDPEYYSDENDDEDADDEEPAAPAAVPTPIESVVHDEQESTPQQTNDPQLLPAVAAAAINVRSRRGHWKQTILDEMKTAMSECCDNCRMNTLTKLERRLHEIQHQIANELHQHYEHVTWDMREAIASPELHQQHRLNALHHHHRHHNGEPHSKCHGRPHIIDHPPHHELPTPDYDDVDEHHKCHSKHKHRQNKMLQLDLEDRMAEFMRQRTALQVAAAGNRNAKHCHRKKHGRRVQKIQHIDEDDVHVDDDDEEEENVSLDVLEEDDDADHATLQLDVNIAQTNAKRMSKHKNRKQKRNQHTFNRPNIPTED